MLVSACLTISTKQCQQGFRCRQLPPQVEAAAADSRCATLASWSSLLSSLRMAAVIRSSDRSAEHASRWRLQQVLQWDCRREQACQRPPPDWMRTVAGTCLLLQCLLLASDVCRWWQPLDGVLLQQRLPLHP